MKSEHIGSSLDGFLREEGLLAQCEAGALIRINNQNMNNKPKVIIEVTGGVAEVTQCPTDVEVQIIDHDNEKVGGMAPCQCQAHECCPECDPEAHARGDMDKCSACGEEAESLHLCPDGRELCDECFHAGQH